jgi:hypothetical protein
MGRVTKAVAHLQVEEIDDKIPGSKATCAKERITIQMREHSGNASK